MYMTTKFWATTNNGWAYLYETESFPCIYLFITYSEHYSLTNADQTSYNVIAMSGIQGLCLLYVLPYTIKQMQQPQNE